MCVAYPVLRYPGNITGEDAVQEGQLLGWDELGRPYEVIDAEFIPEAEIAEWGSEEPVDRRSGYTNVYMQYARPETLQAQAGRFQASTMRVALLEQQLRAKWARAS